MPTASAELAAAAEAVGLRLRACLAEALRLAARERGDDPWRSGQQLKDALGVEGVVARRLVRMLDAGAGGVEVLTRAPSPASLRSLAESLAPLAAGGAHPAWRTELAALVETIGRFDALARRAGSKGALTAALRGSAEPAVDDTGARSILRLAADGVVRDLNDRDTGGRWSDAALLDGPPVAGDPALLWSGAPAEGPPWTAEAAAALAVAIDGARRAGAGRVLLRTHARHVLCDAQRSLRVASTWRAEAAELALDPAALLEPALLGDAEDHLRRAVAAAAPASAAVVLGNIGDDGRRGLPLHRGAVDPGLLAQLAAETPARVPLLLADEDVDRQLAILAAAGVRHGRRPEGHWPTLAPQ